MDWNTAQQLLRILLQFGSGVLISKGVLTEEMAVTLTGGVISVASVIWWIAWNKKEVK
ncbi:Pam3-gp28 family putative phage holin [Agrobacterium arsenijevicii]|uniref:Pam3-gp28 family putative phage holin n=1 Tax=Agrobacterium arsenijevicii TaxID=1585697 RepID=UPI000AE207C8